MKKRNKVKRIAARPRNAPKYGAFTPVYLVTLPEKGEPTTDQTLRNQVADAIEASIHPQRFTGIEEAAAPPRTFTPGDIEAALRKQPAFQELDDAPPAKDTRDHDWTHPIITDTSKCEAPSPICPAKETAQPPAPPSWTEHALDKLSDGIFIGAGVMLGLVIGLATVILSGAGIWSAWPWLANFSTGFLDVGH